MQNKKMLTRLAAMSIAIVLIMSGLFGPGSLTLRAQTTSVPSSQPQATPVSQDEALRRACADTLTELIAARKLIASQDQYALKQVELQQLSDQISNGRKDLRTLDAQEKQHLRDAVTAADKEIAALKAEVVVLKKERMTIWKKAKWFVIGGAIGIAVGFALKR